MLLTSLVRAMRSAHASLPYAICIGTTGSAILALETKGLTEGGPQRIVTAQWSSRVSVQEIRCVHAGVL